MPDPVDEVRGSGARGRGLTGPLRGTRLRSPGSMDSCGIAVTRDPVPPHEGEATAAQDPRPTSGPAGNDLEGRRRRGARGRGQRLARGHRGRATALRCVDAIARSGTRPNPVARQTSGGAFLGDGDPTRPSRLKTRFGGGWAEPAAGDARAIPVSNLLVTANTTPRHCLEVAVFRAKTPREHVTWAALGSPVPRSEGQSGRGDAVTPTEHRAREADGHRSRLTSPGQGVS